MCVTVTGASSLHAYASHRGRVCVCVSENAHLCVCAWARACVRARVCARVRVCDLGSALGGVRSQCASSEAFSCRLAAFITATNHRPDKSSYFIPPASASAADSPFALLLTPSPGALLFTYNLYLSLPLSLSTSLPHSLCLSLFLPLALCVSVGLSL